MRLNAHFDMLPERAFKKKLGSNRPDTLEGGKGGGGGSAPAPDPNIGIAQLKLAEISEEYLQQWKAEVWPALKETTLKQEARADEQFAIDKEIQRGQLDLAKTTRAEFEKAAPMRQKIYDEAFAAGGESDLAKQSALALGDVKSQFGIQAQQNERQMKSYGIDPTSGKFQGQARTAGIMEAATSAAAATKARDAATQLGWAKRMDAAALAQGQFGNQASSTGLALTAGQQALGAGQTTMGNYGAMGSSMGQAYGGAMQGWGQVGQVGVQKYNADVNAYSATQQANAAQSSALGSTIGSLAGAGAYAYA
jgi:hypothetical protein